MVDKTFCKAECLFYKRKTIANILNRQALLIKRSSRYNFLMIKVILWDLDGTLLNFSKGEKYAIKKAFSSFRFGECTDEMIRIYSQINNRWWEALERNEVTKPQVLVGRYRDFFKEIGIDPSFAEAFNDEYEKNLGKVAYYNPNSKRILSLLKGKVIQCCVTNGAKPVQDAKLRLTNFDEFFDYVFISEVVGYEKPNREFFEEIFGTIGSYQKEEIMIVGDSLTSDILGGRNCGIKTCYYNPFHKKNIWNISYDTEIEDLIDVLNLIDLKK